MPARENPFFVPIHFTQTETSEDDMPDISNLVTALFAQRIDGSTTLTRATS